MLQKKHEQKDDAVSPVIGVMLMLVVTIIIAAAVAAFAGGITGTTEETPTIMAKTEIWSAESYSAYMTVGRFVMTVESVSAPISTKDLKLVTSWTNKSGVTQETTVIGTTTNTDYTGSSAYKYNSPLGYGTGVPGDTEKSGGYPLGQWFGNYQLTAGTSLVSNGAASDNPGTVIGHIAGSGMDALFGKQWSEEMKKGDVVTVQLVYIPTNTVIYNEEVIVR